jgi:hypothetical protein
MLRRVPEWSDGMRTLTARLLEQSRFYEMDDVVEPVSTLWREHLKLQTHVDNCAPDFFSPEFDLYVDDIKLRRWNLSQRTLGPEGYILSVELLELTAWPGDNEHGSVWVQNLGMWSLIAKIIDGWVKEVADASPELIALVQDFQVIRREYDVDYDYHHAEDQ